MKAKSAEINLLPQEAFESSTIGRTLKWLLTTFRYIVIGTEMIVLAAFLSRFYLDTKSSDLIDAITQKKSIISSYSSFENTFRQTQDKLKTFSNFASDNKKVSPAIDGIATLIPSDLTLTGISINAQKIQIIVSTQNENSASSFVDSLNSSDFVSNAGVVSVQSQLNTSNVSVIISGNLKGRPANGI